METGPTASEKMPKYEAGKEILYTVTEDAVADYTTEITGYDITNSYAPGKTSVTVTKAWADNDGPRWSQTEGNQGSAESRWEKTRRRGNTLKCREQLDLHMV